jgi:hypothetical protein
MSRTATKVVFVTVLLGILITALALGAVSFASYPVVNGAVESLRLSSTHRAGLFSRTAYERVIFNLRCSAFGAFLAAALMFRFRKNTENFIRSTFEDFLRFGAELYRRAVQFVHGDVLEASALLFLCVEGLALRLRYLFEPVRYDEAVTYLYYARKPVVVGMSFYSAPNNHVFHTVLVHFAVLLFGNHPWAFRLPALASGILLLPCSYGTFRRLYARDAALLTVAFLATSAALVEYSTSARGYMGICLCFVILAWLGEELLRSESLSRWMCFVGVAAVGFYTIPIMLYPFAMVVLWLVICAWLLRLRTGFFLRLLCASVAALVAAAILYLPVLVVSGRSALFSNRFVQSRSWPYFLSNILQSFAATWKSWNAAIPQPLAIVLLLAFIGGAILERRTLRAPASLLVGLISISVLLVLQRVVPFERVWLFLIPLYFGVASVGIVMAACALPQGAGWQYSHVVAIAAILVSIGLSAALIHTNVIYASNQGKDSEAIAELLKDRLKTGDRVIAEVPYDAPLEYYFDKHMVPTDFLYCDPKVSDELFVVSKTGRAPESVLSEIGEPIGDGLRSPELIKRFADTNLFEVGRLRPAAGVRNRGDN